MNELYIHRVSAFLGDASVDVTHLKEAVGRYTRENFRRVNRFILLALLGARQCIDGLSLDADTGVYLTTEHGNLGETAEVLDEIYIAHSLPKPFGFINTMSNTAAFYLAKNLAIRGRNLIVSSQHLSFERGLELLMVDFARGAERSALIGGVDEALLSRTARDGEADRGWRLVDGSAWFYVRPDRDEACGRFAAVQSFRDSRACLAWIEKRRQARVDVLSFGALINDREAALWKNALHPAFEFTYLQDYGYCGSATACGVGMFMQLFPGKILVHLNKDQQGRYAVMEVERYEDQEAAPTGKEKN